MVIILISIIFSHITGALASIYINRMVCVGSPQTTEPIFYVIKGGITQWKVVIIDFFWKIMVVSGTEE